MKRFFITLTLMMIFFINSQTALAQIVDCETERCATCDLCGYCLKPTPQPPPGNWESCRDCLYPSLTSALATDNQTLKIDEITNSGPTPYPGSWYTMLGCIKTGVGGFSNQGAAGGVIQTLLNSLFGIVGGVAFIYILYGSFLILTSQADMERLNHGRRVVLGAIIGVVFSLSAVFIVNLIGRNILKIPGFGGPTP